MPKTFCYSNICNIVETGFRLDVYYVCKECKQEVDKNFKERMDRYHEEERLKEEERQKRKRDSEPYLFEFLDFPGGD